ncbi:MAG1140 family protein [Mesomycoplasma conjunctivae]|uniref:MAG1140 family protein n=1 Tax=Mesomycoplasma conjunctivae TaxID=45361 RepID=UPI003DA5C81C
MKLYQNKKIHFFTSLLFLIILIASIYLFLQIRVYKSVVITIQVDKDNKIFTLINSDIYYQLKKGDYAKFIFDKEAINLEIVKIISLKQDIFEIEFTKTPFLKPQTQILGQLILKDNDSFLKLFLN